MWAKYICRFKLENIFVSSSRQNISVSSSGQNISVSSSGQNISVSSSGQNISVSSSGQNISVSSSGKIYLFTAQILFLKPKWVHKTGCAVRAIYASCAGTAAH